MILVREAMNLNVKRIRAEAQGICIYRLKAVANRP